MVTSIILALQLFYSSLCSSLLTTSWFLLCEALKCVMLFTTFPSTLLSVGHQRWSQSYLRITSFFSPTSFSQFASSNFVNSDHENSVFCNAFNHFSVYSVVCWSAEMVTSTILASELFCWYLFCDTLLAFPYSVSFALRSFKVCNAFYNFFINNVVCCSPEMVTFVILAFDFFPLTYLSQFVSSHLKDWGLRSFEAYIAGYYFRYLHCSLLLYRDGHNHHPRIATFFKLSFCSSLLTTLWFLLGEAPKCLMHFTIFPFTLLSVGRQRWSQSYLRIASFFSLTSFAQFASSNFVNSDHENSIVCNAFNHFSVYSVVCRSAEMVTSHKHHPRIATFLKLSFCSSLLTTSWFLLCEALKCVMLFATFPSTLLSVGHRRWSQSYLRIASFFSLTSSTVRF